MLVRLNFQQAEVLPIDLRIQLGSTAARPSARAIL